MITAYHRPHTMDGALKLIKRKAPLTLPLGGGTLLSHPTVESIEVVDLQHLGLNHIRKQGNTIEIGSNVTLQQWMESEHCSEVFKSALKLEAPLNLRNAASVAGTLVVADGRSTFALIMLALDAKITFDKTEKEIPIGNFLPRPTDYLPGKLITKIKFPANVKLAFDLVSRTPADKPIVCAALAQWPSGRTRLALGGYGPAPLLALDGTRTDEMAIAARNAFHDAADEWASAGYRMDMGAILTKRCIENI